MAKPHARIRDPVLLTLRVWKKFSRILGHMLLALYQVHKRIQYVREPTISNKLSRFLFTPHTFRTLITLRNIKLEFIKLV